MERREILKLGLTAVLVPFLPDIVRARQGPHPASLSIGNIFQASFQTVLKEMRQGRPWAGRELNQLTESGVLTFQSLGPQVVFPSGYQASVQELQVPIVWSIKDEKTNQREVDKISLVASLIENGVEAHDDYLYEQVKLAKRIIVSTEYHYNLGATQAIPWEGETTGYVVKLYTTFAVEPA